MSEAKARSDVYYKGASAKPCFLLQFLLLYVDSESVLEMSALVRDVKVLFARFCVQNLAWQTFGMADRYAVVSLAHKVENPHNHLKMVAKMCH